MKKLFMLVLCVLVGCAEVIIDTSSKGKGGGDGGSGGSDETSSTSGSGGSETISSVTGSGGTGGSETTTSDGGSMTTTTSSSTTTSTETFVCEAGPKECKEGTCFCPSDHACCNDPVNYTMCVGNENGYCCPEDMFCIPKG